MAEARRYIKLGYNGFLSTLLLLAIIQEVGIFHASDLTLLNPGQREHCIYITKDVCRLGKAGESAFLDSLLASGTRFFVWGC